MLALTTKKNKTVSDRTMSEHLRAQLHMAVIKHDLTRFAPLEHIPERSNTR